MKRSSDALQMALPARAGRVSIVKDIHEVDIHNKHRKLPGWAAESGEEAKAYFHSLLVPEDGAARYPDLSTFPTVPLKTRYFFALNWVNVGGTAAGDRVCVLVVRPNLREQYQMASAVANDGTITYSAAYAPPFYTGGASNFSMYRPISFSVTLHDSRSALNRSGRIIQDLQFVQQSAGTAPLNCAPLNTSLIYSSPTQREGGCSNDYLVENPRQAWVPLLEASKEFCFWQSYSTQIPVATGFGTLGPVVVFLINLGPGDLNDGIGGPIIAEVNYNCEATVLPAAAAFFDAKPAVGDPSDIAKILANKLGDLFGLASSTVQGLTKVVGPLSNMARSVVKHFGNSTAMMGTPTPMKGTLGMNPLFLKTCADRGVDPVRVVDQGQRLLDVFNRIVVAIDEKDIPLADVVTLLDWPQDQCTMKVLKSLLDVIEQFRGFSPGQSELSLDERYPLPKVLKPQAKQGLTAPSLAVARNSFRVPPTPASSPASALSSVPTSLLSPPSGADTPLPKSNDISAGWFGINRK